MLLHFLDDFLYISTNKNNVRRFVTIMHKKDSKYRCTVNNKKSMVNFDLIIDNEKINKIKDYGKYLIVLFYFYLFY